MSTVYNPEAETMGEIERLEIEAREVSRHLAQARQEEDRRVLHRQLQELEQQIKLLQAKLPY